MYTTETQSPRFHKPHTENTWCVCEVRLKQPEIFTWAALRMPTNCRHCSESLGAHAPLNELCSGGKKQL